MKKPSRLVLLVSSSLFFCIVPIRRSEECGSYPDWEEYRVRFFQPGLDGAAALSPFHYTLHALSYAGNDPEGNDRRRNCLEWQTYLGRDVRVEDINTVLYGDMSADAFLTALKNKELEQAFPKNTFLQKLSEPRWRAALDYLTFVKQVEFAQHAADDPWADDYGFKSDFPFFDWEKESQSLNARSLRQLAAHANDPFLKKRYAYQAIVTNRYYGSDSLAAVLFDRHFSLRDTTVLMPWALLHKAECLFQRGDAYQYNYLLAKVFDRCDSKKVRAMDLFNPDWTEQTLPFAPTPQDKALVLMMKAIQYPGRTLPLLRRIAAYDPACRYLPMLVAREVNKLEDWVMTEKLTGYGPSVPYGILGDDWEQYDKIRAKWRRENLRNDRAYLREVLAWVEAQARASRLAEQQGVLWLAAAHLHFLAENHDMAAAFLEKIPSQAAPRLLAQRDLERLLLAPYVLDLRSAEGQAALVCQLRQLHTERRYLDRPAVQWSCLDFYLCHAFFRLGDIPTAGLFYNRAVLTNNNGGSLFSGYDHTEFFNAHASFGDMERLLALLEKKRKTPLETYLLETPERPTTEEINFDGEGYYWYHYTDQMPAPMPPKEALLDLQGTIAFRDGDLVRAEAAFAQASSEFWQRVENQVNTDIFADAKSFPFQKDTTPQRGGKLEVVRQMLALEAESRMATGERLAEIYYQLGNGWFNCSYWGQSWYMFSYSRSQSDDDSPEIRTAGDFPATPDVRKYGITYFRFDRALAWYQRALAAKPSKELAARIEYMVADCDRYVRVLHRGNYYGYDDGKQAQSPLFRKWARRYGRTAVFVERMEHCPELRTYLGR